MGLGMYTNLKCYYTLLLWTCNGKLSAINLSPESRDSRLENGHAIAVHIGYELA